MMSQGTLEPGAAGSIAAEVRARVVEAVLRVVVLEDKGVLDLLLVGLMCGGHILLDDIPGVGKTLLARTFARSLGLDFRRIQFTPDLLPSDVTGLNFFNQKTSEFEFRPGPVFAQVLLADEINRATPRTQSSLLECMQESTVTVDGVTRRLGPPFLVIATQNPVEMEGTFPLPEAELDRFLMCLRLGYPSIDGERDIVLRFLNDDPLARSGPVLAEEELAAFMATRAEVHFARPVLDYALELARETRRMEGVRLGASPRGALYLARAAQALAALRGRSYVVPDDVQDVVVPVLAHRLLPDVQSSLYEVTGPALVRQVLEKVPVPVGPHEGDAR